MVEQIIVPFEGNGAGVGGLTWGQQQVWRAMVEVDSSMSMGGVVPVLDGRTVEDFAAELRFFMSRYGSMRSKLRFGHDGEVTQEVFGSGEATMWVHDARPGEDPAAVADAVFAEWKARNFDYAYEWPIRMAVVRQGGAVTHVIVLVCHLATDGNGLATMIRELGERDPATREPTGPYPAMQPFDLVAAQLERGAQGQTDSAIRYWEGHLRSIRPRRFAPAADRGEPRFRQVVWRSRALLLAGERLAARLGVDAAPVLLAAYAVAFGRVTGGAPFVSQVIVGNRFRPGLADVVSPLAQNGLVVLDVAGVDAGEAVRRARQASTTASKYAYYEPGARLALIKRIAKERGEPVDLAVFYNDRRATLRTATAGAVPSGDEIVAARAETAVVLERPMGFFNEELMINVDDVPDTVQITTEVDTAALAIEDLHALLTEMESFAVEAALDPSAPTAVRDLSESYGSRS
ncbi:hypothetical protein Drose_11815 [Dactylosporangium roseum]|uniref:Condensation domain-containing protein n=1 Tax=Dactylosporangium roseum TaxID=47989 RepID=A0ABY5ZBK4_9ACTN|nr:condensation domain-containing protein [Dactylosporangium roseum]UWZ38842.1 hypothetical protein Drose_11815 [Dactylosporangium roseum]